MDRTERHNRRRFQSSSRGVARDGISRVGASVGSVGTSGARVEFLILEISGNFFSLEDGSGFIQLEVN